MGFSAIFKSSLLILLVFATGSRAQDSEVNQFDSASNFSFGNVNYTRTVTGSSVINVTTTEAPEPNDNIQIDCASTEIKVRIKSPHPQFNGMIYPQGLSKNSSCLEEYHNMDEDWIEYRLPLRSCNTMKLNQGSNEEFYNTIVLENQAKLVTGQGQGFHIRCTYKHNINVQMAIYKNGKELRSEHVQLGDPLMLNISFEHPSKLPFIVTDCKVRDGLGWSEQLLVNRDGCTVDPTIMGTFQYDTTGNFATVDFLAHKFPYSSSLYYACNVRVCKSCTPPLCAESKNIRKTREANFDDDEQPATTIEVSDSLWVKEVQENERAAEEADIRKQKERNGELLCINPRDFAIAIAVSGLILVIAVIVLIFVLCLRRRNSVKGSSESNSSIYSGGYTNTAYSHSS